MKHLLKLNNNNLNNFTCTIFKEHFNVIRKPCLLTLFMSYIFTAVKSGNNFKIILHWGIFSSISHQIKFSAFFFLAFFVFGFLENHTHFVLLDCITLCSLILVHEFKFMSSPAVETGNSNLVEIQESFEHIYKICTTKRHLIHTHAH